MNHRSLNHDEHQFSPIRVYLKTDKLEKLLHLVINNCFLLVLGWLGGAQLGHAFEMPLLFSALREYLRDSPSVLQLITEARLSGGIEVFI
jgi:hypothetical protein